MPACFSYPAPLPGDLSAAPVPFVVEARRSAPEVPAFRQYDGPAALSFPRRLSCRGPLGADA
ncbi:hypothetical protein AB8O64_08280 [Streptomyces sp. QH1-20]|uniref:hypothetical protein n=1 Tax=Streptomyces sp. QH1-20 TaxID=3240934 RepID=UPI00351510E8